MTDLELLEYAIYHWVFGGSYKLPGLNDKGFPDPNFLIITLKKTIMQLSQICSM